MHATAKDERRNGSVACHARRLSARRQSRDRAATRGDASARRGQAHEVLAVRLAQDQHEARALPWRRHCDAQGKNVVKGRRLIAEADLDLETRTVALKAFDAAWAEIAQNFGDEPADVESGRMHLAHAILIVARADSRDPERLKTEALQVMALAYKGLARD